MQFYNIMNYQDIYCCLVKAFREFAILSNIPPTSHGKRPRMNTAERFKNTSVPSTFHKRAADTPCASFPTRSHPRGTEPPPPAAPHFLPLLRTGNRYARKPWEREEVKGEGEPVRVLPAPQKSSPLLFLPQPRSLSIWPTLGNTADEAARTSGAALTTA